MIQTFQCWDANILYILWKKLILNLELFVNSCTTFYSVFPPPLPLENTQVTARASCITSTHTHNIYYASDKKRGGHTHIALPPLQCTLDTGSGIRQVVNKFHNLSARCLFTYFKIYFYFHWFYLKGFRYFLMPAFITVLAVT